MLAWLEFFHEGSYEVHIILKIKKNYSVLDLSEVWSIQKNGLPKKYGCSLCEGFEMDAVLFVCCDGCPDRVPDCGSK